MGGYRSSIGKLGYEVAVDVSDGIVSWAVPEVLILRKLVVAGDVCYEEVSYFV